MNSNSYTLVWAAVAALAAPSMAQPLEPADGFGLPDGLSGIPTYLGTLDFGDGPELVAAGPFEFADGVRVNGLAAFDGVRWRGLGDGSKFELTNVVGTSMTWIEDVALFDFGDGAGASLVVGGWFDSVGGEPMSTVARFDGSRWRPVGDGLSFPSSSAFAPAICGMLEVMDTGDGPRLYAGGRFTRSGDVELRGHAFWDRDHWSPVGVARELEIDHPALRESYIYDGVVYQAADGPRLAVATNGAEINIVGRNCAGFVFEWDGDMWHCIDGPGYLGGPFGNSRRNNVEAIRDLDVLRSPDGDTLYGGGAFRDRLALPDGRVFPIPFHVARWDGERWLPEARGSAPNVFDPVVQRITVGRRAGGGPVEIYGTLNKDLRPRRAAPSDDPNAIMPALVLVDGLPPRANSGNNLVVEGPLGFVDMLMFPPSDPVLHHNMVLVNFADGAPVTNLSRLVDGAWETVTGIGERDGLGPNSFLAGVVRLKDSLVIGGDMSLAGDVEVRGVAAFRDGAWSSLGEGLFDPEAMASGVLSVAVLEDNDGESLYAFGEFTRSGAQDTPGVARWNGESWEALISPDGDRPSRTPMPGATMEMPDGRRVLIVSTVIRDSDGEVSPNNGVLDMWDGERWAPLNPHIDAEESGFTGSVLAVHDDGAGEKLYVAGALDDGEKRVVRWDGETWEALPGSFSALRPKFSSAPDNLLSVRTEDENWLVAWRGFSDIDGDTSRGLYAAWDGQEWIGLPDLREALGNSGSVTRLDVVTINGVDRLVATGFSANVLPDGTVERDDTPLVRIAGEWAPIPPVGGNGFALLSLEEYFHDGEWALAARGSFQSLGDVESHQFAILKTGRKLGDLDGDGVVGRLDLMLLLIAFGSSEPAADIDFDGVVGVGDLRILVSQLRRSRGRAGAILGSRTLTDESRRTNSYGDDTFHDGAAGDARAGLHAP